MNVKCRICGTTVDKEIAYKVTIKGKNTYFCSQEEYEKDLAVRKRAAADKDKVYRLICEIIGRQEIVNTILWKEWVVWNKVATNEVIGLYLTEHKDYLVGTIARLDDIEFNRIKYLSAVLKNKLGDFKPKAKDTITQTNINDEHYETKFKPKTRRALLDFEEDCCE